MNSELDQILFKDLAAIIEQGKQQVAVQVNSALNITFRQVGHKINTYTLNQQRAGYAKEIVLSVSIQLVKIYGRSFTEKNLRRMMQFARVFHDIKIVVTLSRQLSWSHFVELIPLKKEEAQMFYAQRIAEEKWSVRETHRQIERKAYERNEIAQVQFPIVQPETQNAFKDPYILDFLGLKEGYLENDLEAAILKELEHFILELGKGFAFVERQKRLIIDGEDFYVDLLFYHRKLKRLIVMSNGTLSQMAQ